MRQQFNRTFARLYTRFPALGRLLSRTVQPTGVAGAIPWTPFVGPLSQTKLALLTTGGPHLRSDPPFDMRDPRGDPSYRAIPRHTPLDQIIITHDYYDHSNADRDLNILLPVMRMETLVEQGLLAGLGTAFGFMGHLTDQHVSTLINQTAPAVARTLRAEGVRAALLTPA